MKLFVLTYFVMASEEQISPRHLADSSFHKFASTTVHHLREPVRAVNIFANLIQQSELGTLSKDSLESFEYLKNAAGKMQNLLDGLAEFAAASAGPSQTAVFDLNLPLSQALTSLREDIELHKVKLTKNVLPSARFDFDQLQLVFHHLLKNALEYSDSQGLEISISAHRTETHWHIAIKDNGPGIDEMYHHQIFNLYSRLHGPSYPGNGLGLAICKTILNNHSGDIWVKSTVNDGSTFVFTLPHFGIDS